MKTEQEANIAIEKYADTVRRICLYYLKNKHDVEDVFQEVFLKYILHHEIFENDEHEKAWIIRVSINQCKDMLKSFFRRKVESIDNLTSEPYYMPEDSSTVLAALFTLPDKYKDVIYLFYYEGYTAVEIAQILNKNENTIYTWLSRAKAKLKDILGRELINML